ncbi:MAG: ATP phosphoribosyltransferase [Dehalococcoidia bacterium]
MALPSGELRAGAAAFIERAGLGSPDYAGGSRTYRPAATRGEAVAYRVFRERDIPIQVALGNYHAGITTSLAVDELLSRHPNEGIIKAGDLDFGHSRLAALGRPGLDLGSPLRVVSEYPGLAEAFALRRRLARYQLFAVAGRAWNYLPEDADIALVAETVDVENLEVLEEVADSSACLVVNREALASLDLSALLAALPQAASVRHSPSLLAERGLGGEVGGARGAPPPASSPHPPAVTLALPDGHQQREGPEICRRAGLDIEGYDEKQALPRPQTVQRDLGLKVVRPQDMPQMVAIGAFDLGLTGRDCLHNHLAQFPNSPVEEVADLQRQRYRWAAVVHESVHAGDLPAALEHWRAAGREVIRIASEYPNIADHFARERHLGRYSVIPVVGASEGFVPEDAEILIEGSETGKTWEANGLVPLQWLFESTMILVANKGRRERSNHKSVEALVTRFGEAA